MAAKLKSSVNFDSHVSSASSMPALSGEVLMGSDLPEDERQHITTETGIDLEIQRGLALKRDYAEYLHQRMSISTAQRYVEFLETQRALLDKKGRNSQDQADLENFIRVLNQVHGDSLLALRNASFNAIASIAAQPASRPPVKPKSEEVIVEPAQSLWGRLRGELQVTRIRR